MKSGTDYSNQQKEHTEETGLSLVRSFLPSNSITEDIIGIVSIDDSSEDQNHSLELNTLNKGSFVCKESIGIEVSSQKREIKTNQIHDQSIVGNPLGRNELTQKVSDTVHKEKEGNTVNWVLILNKCSLDYEVGQIDNQEVILNNHRNINLNVINDDLNKSLLSSVLLSLDLFLKLVSHLNLWSSH